MTLSNNEVFLHNATINVSTHNTLNLCIIPNVYFINFKKDTKMRTNIFNYFNVKNRSVLFGVTLSVLTSISIAQAPKLDIASIINDPILSNSQNQNDVELIMTIMKAIEDKDIQGVDKKIEFANTFKVSDYIKNTVKSYINQNINYSDNQRISYGIYRLKLCNHASNTNEVWPDFRKSGNQCFSFPLYDCTP